jgi:ubiquitin-conjugating enzyme E2 M
VASDLAELMAHKFTAQASTRITFPHGRSNLRRFLLLVTPNAGLYARASFLFSIIIPPTYPFSPPRVRCHTPVLHPCIAWRRGEVHLQLLKHDWKPVLTLNAVILALQLLFLEPWPVLSSGHSAASSALPPSRPQVSTPIPFSTFDDASAATSISVASAAFSSAATAAASAAASPALPQSTLSLVSSKSAAACSVMQLNEESILNLELLPLIRNGDRAMFEEWVRQTLNGCFLFGHNWRRNRAPAGDGEDDDDGDDDVSVPLHSYDSDNDATSSVPPNRGLSSVAEEPMSSSSKSGGTSGRSLRFHPPRSSSPFDALLQRVEAHGRQAHVSAAAAPSARAGAKSAAGAGAVHTGSYKGERREFEQLMMDDDGAACAGQRTPPRLSSAARTFSGSPAASASASPVASYATTPRKRRPLIPPHRKRSYSKMSPNDAHVPNPAAELVLDSSEDAPRCYKRARGTPAAGGSAPQASKLRVALTTRHRQIKLRLIEQDVAPAVASAANGSHHQSRKRMQRPAPAAVSSSISDGELDDEEVSTLRTKPFAASATAVAVDDAAAVAVGGVVRTSSDTQARRAKKARPSAMLLLLQQQKTAASANADVDDEPTARELEHIALMHAQLGMADVAAAASSSAAAGGLLGPSFTSPRPTSTTIPDLASFATFRAVAPEAALLSSTTAAAAAARTQTRAASAIGTGGNPAVASSPDQHSGSGSPKRNVSNAEGVSFDSGLARGGNAAGPPPNLMSPFGGLPPARTGSNEATSSSFLLGGRSSSRSINLFGSIKGHVLAVTGGAGPGLANLRDLDASLPPCVAMRCDD